MKQLNPANSIILTVPRSGSNLLENTLEAMSLIRLPKTHGCWDTKGYGIITIARDPLDTITSWAAMRMHYRDGEIRKDLVRQYCSTYQFLIDNADIILDYNELVEDPYKITNGLIKSLGMKAFFDTPKIARNPDVPSRRYLVTSTTSEYYDQAREYASKQDLSYCYELYNKLLSLKTVEQEHL